MRPPPARLHEAINSAAFDAAKAKANSLPVGASRPFVLAPTGPAPTVPNPLTLVIKGINFNGAHQQTGADDYANTSGAIGSTHFVETTSGFISAWIRAIHPTLTSLSLVFNMSLNTFFGYAATSIHDGRVIYDANATNFSGGRGVWIVTAVGDSESNHLVTNLFIAVSQTNDPTGRYFKYAENVDFLSTGASFDFPQVGIDALSVLFTGNPSTLPIHAAFFAVSKAALYNNISPDFVPVFSNLASTITPPIVLDSNPQTFLLSNDSSLHSHLIKYTVLHSNLPSLISITPSTIVVTPFQIPPDALQPGSTTRLHTGDGRFVSNTYQNGNDLWATHTIGEGPYPTPFFYRIDTTTNLIQQSGFYFESPTSYDWNASIAANAVGDCFVGWISTDLSVVESDLPQVMVSGKLNADSGIDPASNVSAFTSPTAFTGTGGPTVTLNNYSAVTIDPSNDASAWHVNAKVNTQGHDSTGSSIWGSRIVKFGN